MGENVQLLHMKRYVLNRLSATAAGTPTVTQNGTLNGGYHSNENVGQADTAVSAAVHQNGFISNKEYGDFDTTPSPTKPEDVMTSTPPRQPRSRPSSVKPKEKFIPETEIEIPSDGSLHEFSVDDMSTFLRHMGIEERIVTHCHKKALDGHKFSKLKDSDLDTLGMKNPIMCHFRDKSVKSKSGSRKKSLPFML